MSDLNDIEKELQLAIYEPNLIEVKILKILED